MEPTGPEYIYRAHAERVHDGDTYQLRIDLGFDVGISIMCRLRGIDTPELGTPEGKAARDWVTGTLKPAIDGSARPLIVQSYKDRRSFARWVCDVWYLDGAGHYASLADALLRGGQAKPLVIP